jgi:hypothetical protein
VLHGRTSRRSRMATIELPSKTIRLQGRTVILQVMPEYGAQS